MVKDELIWLQQDQES